MNELGFRLEEGLDFLADSLPTGTPVLITLIDHQMREGDGAGAKHLELPSLPKLQISEFHPNGHFPCQRTRILFSASLIFF